MTAAVSTDRRLPSPSDDAGWDAATVAAIAGWSWVSPAAHIQAHPTGAVQGCPGCSQPAVCGWCGDRQGRCRDWVGHADQYRSSEVRLLATVSA